MNVSRAAFLKVVGLALVGAGADARSVVEAALAPAVEPASVPSEQPGQACGPFRLQDATAAQFRPHLNTSFTVRSAGGARASLVLVKVVEGPVATHFEQFSLVFHAHGGVTLDDGTHAVRHPALGGFNLFVVPIDRSNRLRRAYEACFSRRVSLEDKACPNRS